MAMVDAPEGFFFPSAMTHVEALHAMFGTSREAFESADAWSSFQPVLAELLNEISSKMFRDLCLGTCMKDAPAGHRRRMHTFEGHKFDWRWEMPEVMCDQLEDGWPVLVKYFDLVAMWAKRKQECVVLAV